MLGLLALFGLAVRVAIILSPLGELDGDEAVVGLMARHVAFSGDRPVFYYGQPYLGSLEAFVAAPLFLLFGASTVALKLVPTLFSLSFLLCTALLARRAFGDGVALGTAAYLALPPVMWAVWSTKARGGYAEVLALGAALLVATAWMAERPRLRWEGLLWGVLAGLTFWTHLLGVVYLLPAGLYLLARRWRTWRERPGELGWLIGTGLVGVLVGAAPMLVDNLSTGFPTLRAMLQPSDLPVDARAQLFRFFRVGVPVLAGLGQPTTSAGMFDADWLNRPAGRAWVAVLAVGLLAVALALHLPSLRALARGASERCSLPALLLVIALVVPPVVSLGRFGFFVSEPRYALPLYSAVPLVLAALWRLPVLVRGAGLVGLLALNTYSIATTDLRLWQPEETVESTRETRAQLEAFLRQNDHQQVYTDYWIAFPLMFESGEWVKAYSISSGFNRYIPPADNVQRTEDPVWVFVADSEAEYQFVDLLRLASVSARPERVSIYTVYSGITPIHRVRPT